MEVPIYRTVGGLCRIVRPLSEQLFRSIGACERAKTKLCERVNDEAPSVSWGNAP